MLNKISSSVYSVVLLNSFSVFSECLISISILYLLIVMVLITYNVYGLMIQKALSECIALILFMACYLMLNDDLIAFDTLDSYNTIYGLTTTTNISSFNNSIINDYLGFFAKFVVCLSSAIYFMLIANSLKEQRLISFEYLLVTLFAVLGLMLLCSSNDLLTAYLAIELSSLASYVLAAFKKNSSDSVESGIKYFITGAISSAFFLLGSSFLYGYTASVNFTDFSYLFGRDTTIISNSQALINSQNFGAPFSFNLLSFILEVGLALICFSVFIKLALAPFHLWSLDVYENSPTSSSFFFAVVSKLSLFVFLVRLCFQAFPDFNGGWQFYSLWIGLFSVFVGCLGGLKQRKLKTLLAYSSTTHMGYALIAFSSGSHLAIQMMFFALVIYIIAGLCTWSIILFLNVKKQDNNEKYSKELGDLTLLGKANPSLAIALAISMFSVAGIPPMAGFVSKMSLFLPVLNLSYYSSYVVVALVSFLLSVISTFYYIRIIKVLYFENNLVGQLYHPINTNQTLTLSILTFLLLFIFVNPTLLYLLTCKVQLSLY